jgi:hypothetical protein
MKTVKTPKGTELQVMSLKGKDYMQVQQRLIWFVEENPRYDIQTTVDTSVADQATARCTVVIFDEDSKVIRKVTSHKTETAKGFADYIEKAETGSLGRALSLLGYGTQFSAELDEGDRIVDSPVTVTKSSAVTTMSEALSSMSGSSESSAASTTVASSTTKPKFTRKSSSGFSI